MDCSRTLATKRKRTDYCVHSLCTKRAYFNYFREKYKIYCREHKLEGMRSKNSMCIHPKCNTHATFNYKNNNKKLYCTKHKKKGMIDIFLQKYCKHDDCYKKAIYKYRQRGVVSFCEEHKKTNMILQNIKSCSHIKCTHHGKVLGQNEKYYCKRHVKYGDVNPFNFICVTNNCINHARYNYENKMIKLYCLEHKKENMINIME